MRALERRRNISKMPAPLNTDAKVAGSGTAAVAFTRTLSILMGLLPLGLSEVTTTNKLWPMKLPEVPVVNEVE